MYSINKKRNKKQFAIEWRHLLEMRDINTKCYSFITLRGKLTGRLHFKRLYWMPQT